jgi:hypothetical protein
MESLEFDKDDIQIVFCPEPIREDDHYTKIEGKIYYNDYNCNNIRIGTVKLIQFNFSNALNEKHNWLDLIDEVDDDTLRLFEPIVEKHGWFTDTFQDMLSKQMAECDSALVIEHLFLKKKYRGQDLLGSILNLINKYNFCPILLSPMPFQHSPSKSLVDLMGLRGDKKNFRKDFKKLCNHYKKHGFEQIGRSKTWVLIQ